LLKVRGKRELSGIAGTVIVFLLLLTGYVSPLPSQIQDNSFLLEEAYNQESGVVQHISTFARAKGGEWNFGFTQEWPLGGIRHQLSYTLLLQHAEAGGTGFGDFALNYRYQLLGNPEARTIMAPRFSVLLPTGNEEKGRGAGAMGLQANLPLTFNPSPGLATHWNAGLTLVPSARAPDGSRATTLSPNLGASLVWLVQPRFNVLMEMLWLMDDQVTGPGSSNVQDVLLLNPGVRMAFDVPGGLQIVPGVAYTVGLTEDSGEDALFLYLSLEHPFKRQ
jgi:hypothetical protein